MDELDDLKMATERNCRTLARWAREQAAHIDALNGKPVYEPCEHCGMSAAQCYCEDQRVAA